MNGTGSGGWGSRMRIRDRRYEDDTFLEEINERMTNGCISSLNYNSIAFYGHPFLTDILVKVNALSGDGFCFGCVTEKYPPVVTTSLLNKPKNGASALPATGHTTPANTPDTSILKNRHYQKFPTGMDLIRDPALNKGRAFCAEEREILGLRGLLPPRETNLHDQAAFIIQNLRSKTSDLDRYNSLISLQDRNETMFYRVLIDNLAELLPIVYTPTVGLACQRFGYIFRRARGMYISDRDRGDIRKILDNWPVDDVRVIVVTDGERILGLGDLGVHGMGIPIGKLSLYTACAGVQPSQCLPITIDVGTNNKELLNDPSYLGLIHERIRGEEYDALLDEFIMAAQDRFPQALIQFEDFGNANAFRLLEKYKDKACVFNDDIQGTAAVALAGIMSALRMKHSKLSEQTIVLFGAGEAATGISDLLVYAMMQEGMDEASARQHCWLIDSKGLVVSSRSDLVSHKQKYAHEHAPLPDLLSVVKSLHPSILIGASGQASAFTEAVLSTMASYEVRPIIFALSNPTSQSECTAEEAYRYTDCRAIFASGSPFDPVTIGGRTITPGQGNNAYVFPGIGLGVIASGAKRVTAEMFFEAAKALSSETSEKDFAIGRVFPSLDRVREVSAKIATAIAIVGHRSNLAVYDEPKDIHAAITAMMYDPVYRSYV
jgi:malate dehydrogenase (oxaloacetate-decarboxylating)(NADP+)